MNEQQDEALKRFKSPQYQTPGEQNVNLVSRHSYYENYLLGDEMKQSLCEILTQVGQTQNDDNSKYLRRQSTLFNTHTKELIEGYADENYNDEN